MLYFTDTMGGGKRSKLTILCYINVDLFLAEIYLYCIKYSEGRFGVLKERYPFADTTKSLLFKIILKDKTKPESYAPNAYLTYHGPLL